MDLVVVEVFATSPGAFVHLMAVGKVIAIIIAIINGSFWSASSTGLVKVFTFLFILERERMNLTFAITNL
jgi:hypothetical protein